MVEYCVWDHKTTTKKLEKVDHQAFLLERNSVLIFPTGKNLIGFILFSCDQLQMQEQLRILSCIFLVFFFLFFS